MDEAPRSHPRATLRHRVRRHGSLRRRADDRQQERPPRQRKHHLIRNSVHRARTEPRESSGSLLPWPCGTNYPGFAQTRAPAGTRNEQSRQVWALPLADRGSHSRSETVLAERSPYPRRIRSPCIQFACASCSALRCGQRSAGSVPAARNERTTTVSRAVRPTPRVTEARLTSARARYRRRSYPNLIPTGSHVSDLPEPKPLRGAGRHRSHCPSGSRHLRPRCSSMPLPASSSG